MSLFGVREQETTKADLEEAEVVGDLGPKAWACLHYLEHLCLLLEQMAGLQQLCLQMQRPPGNPEAEEEKPPAWTPLPPPSPSPGK